MPNTARQLDPENPKSIRDVVVIEVARGGMGDFVKRLDEHLKGFLHAQLQREFAKTKDFQGYLKIDNFIRGITGGKPL